MKIIASTTFSDAGYQEYGHRLIETFARFWPETVTLNVYYDNVPSDGWNVTKPNIHYIRFDDQDLIDFKTRNKNHPKQSGNGTNSDFLKDGIRFSHKVFAYIDTSLNHGADISIWLDGDTITHAPVQVDDILAWLNGKMAATLLRPWAYTETGFHAFDMRHPNAISFMEDWKSWYTQDRLWDLDDHTDCHTYDATMKLYPADDWNNLSPDFKHSHPFVNGVLGNFMDHCKGPRKALGKSKASDLAIKRNEDYWK